MFTKLVATGIAFIGYGVLNHIVNPVQTLITANMAGNQFNNSDISYVSTIVGFDLVSHISLIPILALVLVLGLIWRSSIFKLFYNTKEGV